MSTREAMELARWREIQSSLNANPASMISWFDDLGTGNPQFRFLSNFYEGKTPIVLPGLKAMLEKRFPEADSGIEFPTGEHAFQALKATNLTDFLRVGLAAPLKIDGEDGELEAPGVAKYIGKSMPLRPDWERVKMDVMVAVLRAKFAPDRNEAAWLLATGDAYLREGTWWHDTTWGVDLYAEGFPGRNWLGTMLMAIRAELRSGVEIDTGLHNLRRAGLGF